MSRIIELEVKKILDEELKLARESIEKAAKKVGDAAVNRLKETSPKRTGKYSRSWRLRAVTLTHGTVSFVVHNARYASLTHLLEKGHALWQGGRSPAIPHIKPAEDQAIKDFEKELTDLIERG